jgi:thymidylate kinase
MILIIEGIDGAGKTMLAEQLSRQTGYPIIHRVKPKTDEEKQRMMGEYLQAIKAGKNMIFDRCWYSEMAYGPVMRDASVISFPQMYELEKILAKQGALIIYCTGSRAALWMRCQKRGEEYVICRDKFNAIYDAYEDIFSAPHHIPVVRYEYKDV